MKLSDLSQIIIAVGSVGTLIILIGTLIILISTLIIIKRQLMLGALSQILKEVGEESQRKKRKILYNEDLTNPDYKNKFRYEYMGDICVALDRLGFLTKYHMIKKKYIINFLGRMILSCWDKLKGYIKDKNDCGYHQLRDKKKKGQEEGECRGVYVRYFVWLARKCDRYKYSFKNNLFFQKNNKNNFIQNCKENAD